MSPSKWAREAVGPGEARFALRSGGRVRVQRRPSQVPREQRHRRGPKDWPELGNDPKSRRRIREDDVGHRVVNERLL